jgi:hypothetical protein
MPSHICPASKQLPRQHETSLARNKLCPQTHMLSVAVQLLYWAGSVPLIALLSTTLRAASRDVSSGVLQAQTHRRPQQPN